jgi:hypothetical protein
MIFTNLYAGLISELTIPLKGEILHELGNIFGMYNKTNSFKWPSFINDLTFWDDIGTVFTTPSNDYTMYD